MKKTPLVCLFIVIGVGIFVLLGAMTELYSGVAVNDYPIVVTDVAPLNTLEEVPISFYHDKHVRALEEEGCESCHGRNAEGKYLFTYPPGRDETSRRSLMDAYHDSCIGCHDDRLAAGKKSGPVTCGECHVPREGTGWMQPAGMDYAVHHTHEVAMNQQCDACHHVYNEKEDRLEYAAGEESSCRDCHRDVTTASGASFREAAHFGCVNCHMEGQQRGEKSGPIACEACHGKAEKGPVMVSADIPRPDRGQPETILLSSDDATMKDVSFNHATHELTTNTCRACHHETLESCDQCHTSRGDPAGGGVTLVDAFHKKTSMRSCVGCHNSMKEDALCAGCHHSMVDASMSEKYCSTCHTGPVEGETVATYMNRPIDLSAILPDDDIIIDVLEDQYGPSTVPHSAIIRNLLDISKGNRLADAFHGDDITICAGCHHYSPPEQAENPPLCRSCHTIDFNPEDLGKPRLIAAYHLQCMGCHQKMGLKTDDCTSCHAAKGDVAAIARKEPGQ